MISTTKKLGVIFVACLAIVWGASAPVMAQAVITSGHARNSPFATSSSEWEGYSEFVRLAQRRLGTARVRPAAQLDFSKLKVNDAVIVVHPLVPLDERSFSAFLADGGRIALLDDFGMGGPFLQKFGIVRQSAPPDPIERLRQNPDLALAFPSVQLVAGAERGRHPIAQGVDAVVTNHPLVLRHPDLTPVLEIRDRQGRSEALAVTGVIAKKGRLFAMGDPSVFINLMLRYPGNRQLAEGLVDYLGERTLDPSPNAQGQRESTLPSPEQPGKLWIVTNHFDQIGHYGEDESLLARLRRHLEEARRSLGAIEEEGIPPILATLLATLLAAWITLSQARGNFPLSRALGHSFARAPLLAAQTGLGARADILGSRQASPILALMELDAALRETATRYLGVNPVGTRPQLSDAFARSGLSPRDAASLAALLVDLRSYGQSLGLGRPKKAPDSTLKNYHREAMRLLNEMRRFPTKRDT